MGNGTRNLNRRAVLAGLAYGASSLAAVADAPLRVPMPVPRPEGFEKRAAPAVEALVQAAKVSGKTSFAVADARTGQMLETMSPLLPQPPASTAKAITALYALDRLGPGFRFRTRLIATGPLRNGKLEGDLILQGGGDPTLSTDALGDLAARLKASGVLEVTGRFRVQSSALPDIPVIDPGQPDHVGYNPTISGLNLNYNRVYFEWKRGGNGYDVTMDARAQKYKPVVTVSRMQVVNRDLPVYTYSSREGRDQWTVARGALGKGGGRWLPVRRPAEYAAEVFQTLARSHGIVLKPGNPVGGGVSGTVIAEHVSPDLRNVLKGMLKYSTNLTAEAVGLTASLAEGPAPRSLSGSGDDMATWLSTTHSAKRPAFVDHSGLGDASRMTANDMVRALVSAGADGSLRSLLKPIPMRDTDYKIIKGHPVDVVAKTGTLNFVSGLAGYLETPSGRDLAFAIFSADMPRRDGLSRAERDRPPGGRTWSSRARRLQQRLMQRWGTVYNA